MNNLVNKERVATPMLFPYEPEQYWQYLREIIREEVRSAEMRRPVSSTLETPGLTYKPLFKMAEVCTMFQITKPTLYEWIKEGKLKPYKIRSRVYFLWQDIQDLLVPTQSDKE